MNYKTIHFKTIDSTNSYLKSNYESYPSFAFVSADYQSNGKGREKRKWNSNSKENLLCSLLLKDNEIIDKYKYLSVGISYVIAKYLEDLGIKQVQIKWPNDVLVNEKKICGILLEGQLPNYVVIGIGLNVNQKEFPSDLNRPATSLVNETNINYSLEKIKNDLYPKIINFCAKPIDFVEEMHDFVRKHNYLLNREIVFPYQGIVRGISDENELIIETETKQIIKIDSKEIVLK